MFKDLSDIVKEQQVINNPLRFLNTAVLFKVFKLGCQAEIDKIFENADVSNAKTKDAFKHIVAADELQRTGNCAISQQTFCSSLH